jgi:hypothetical protein
MTASDAIELSLELVALEPAPASSSCEDRRRPTVDLVDDETLVAIALEYRTRSARFVACNAPAVRPAAATPTPTDVILRFHSGIYFKTTRALVGRALAVAGMTSWRGGADACAAQVFAYAARSAEALSRLPDGDERRALTALLEGLLLGLDRRFPEARGRSGLANRCGAAWDKRPPGP